LGIDCGIAPSDLSNDALLQTPPQATPNEIQMMTTMQFECSYGGPFWNWNILSIMNVSATFLFLISLSREVHVPYLLLLDMAGPKHFIPICLYG